MQNIQVAIVDAHQLSREGLKALLAGGAYEVISATTTLDAALGEITAGLRPGLLVLVLGDRGETFQDAALQQIRAVVPDCKVALIANDGSSALLERAIGWRVNALLRSDMSMDVLVRSLHLVMLGQDIFPAVRPGNRDESGASTAELVDFRAGRRISDREGHVLRSLLSGHSNKAIARELSISEATVKVHLKAVLRKLNLRNRTQAAIWAAGNGFSAKSDSAHPPSAIELVA